MKLMKKDTCCCGNCQWYYANECRLPDGAECDYRPLSDEDYADRRLGYILYFVIIAACIIGMLLISSAREKRDPVQIAPDPVSAVSLLRQQNAKSESRN